MQGPSHNESNHTPSQDGQEQSQRLLELLAALEGELHPGGESRKIALDSSLEKDIGIDSLARVELLFRIEKWFGVALSTQGYAEAETPRDLLNLIGSAERQPITASQPHISLPEIETAIDYPAEAMTLTQALKWHCEQHPERTHLLLYEDDEQVTPISYAELYQEAQEIAGGLLHTGLQPGQTAAIMLPTSRDYFISFFAILLCGAIPVPIYPPARLSQIEDHLRRHARILDNARARVMITTQEIVPLARLLKAQTGALQSVVTTQMLMGTANSPVSMEMNPWDIAFLQYTSGSTGQPKGVKLSHFNLLANIRAMGEAIRVGPQDVFVSWLPLYHDMGLIGAWLGSLYHGIPLVVMSPLLFLSRPYRWLKVIQQYGGTLSAAPNFAYELCLSKVDDSSIEGLDLSSWRMAFNGAEPVSPNTIRRFTQRFAPYGFRAEAMAPVYGLAESAVGLAFPLPGRLPPIDRLQRAALDRDGSAIPAADSDPDALEVVACGQPLRGHQVRIVDDLGRELPERKVGYLQFQGPSATSGYLHNPQATERLFNGPWLDSGDLAYIAAGDIYLTSRAKEIIIRAGRNIYPHELEEAVGDIEGVRKGCVAVFGSKDPRYGTERLIVVAETRSTDSAIHQQLREKIMAASVDLTGLAADEVRLVGPHAVR
jgi:acyl-CoA synthetase (AMP-forming)/AMP-acid ligase II/acyl carrier protein